MRITGRTAAAIAASVEEGLHAGLLLPGEALPPVRALAAELGVAAGTTAAAYRLLRERGVVETHGRGGTRLRARPATTERNLIGPEAPPGTRDLARGEPDPALLPDLELPDPAGWRPAYGDPPILPAFADVARRVLTADGIPADHLAVTSGALDAHERAFGAHLRPGDTVAVEDPGWGNLLDLLAAMRLHVHPVPVDDNGPDAAAVAAALDEGCRALVVTTRAQNPTGASVSADRARILRQVLAAHPATLVVEDDHGNDIAGPRRPHTLAKVTTRWVHVRSASKAYGPDLRCAAVAGDRVSIDRLAGRQRLGPGRVSHLLQYATARAWAGGPGREAAERARQAYTRRRNRLLGALAERGVEAHGVSGINVWVPVRDETAAVAHLLAHGWLVAPGARYRIRSGPGVRVTVATLARAEVGPLADALAQAARGRSGRAVV